MKRISSCFIKFKNSTAIFPVIYLSLVYTHIIPYFVFLKIQIFLSICFISVSVEISCSKFTIFCAAICKLLATIFLLCYLIFGSFSFMKYFTLSLLQFSQNLQITFDFIGILFTKQNVVL